MLTKTQQAKIDNLWDKFWSGGIANPLAAMEQISYLLFMRRLGEMDRKRLEDAEWLKQSYTSLFAGKYQRADGRKAQETGFRPEILEKVLQLLHLLESFLSHPYLKDRIVLKGGTALNLFYFDVPRLSVDIDLNYIGAVDREAMLQEIITRHPALNWKALNVKHHKNRQ